MTQVGVDGAVPIYYAGYKTRAQGEVVIAGLFEAERLEDGETCGL